MLGSNFLGTECAACADAADVDDDGASNITDPIYLLNFLFTGGPDPAAPGGACGPDPTPDDLGCAAFAPCVPVTGPDDIPTARGNATVIPIEHATVVLRWDGKTIYVDPVDGAARFSGLPPPDLILVTDTHGDHMDGATIRAVAVAGTTLVMPAAVSTSLTGSGGIGPATPLVLANGATATVGGIGIEALPMYNLTAGRLQYHAKGRGNGYVLDLAGTRVYFSGDTEDIPEMRALTGIDCAFLCMNLPFTMTPDQAASAALEFKPRAVYPYHYRGSDTNRFKTLVEAGSEEIEVRLREWYP
jgi:L-ascorbate metabolism protein UlaG (beta-lactamase superfamily)